MPNGEVLLPDGRVVLQLEDQEDHGEAEAASGVSASQGGLSGRARENVPCGFGSDVVEEEGSDEGFEKVEDVGE